MVIASARTICTIKSVDVKDSSLKSGYCKSGSISFKPNLGKILGIIPKKK
jgi:hypothetical protein